MPVIPHAAAEKASAGDTAPSTPRAAKPMDGCTPPMFVHGQRKQRPPLMDALEMGSIDSVRKVLQSSSEVINEPFWDQDLQSPLCHALSIECSVEIIQLLIEHGAKTDGEDLRGNTPSSVLRKRCEAEVPQCPPWCTGKHFAEVKDFGDVFAALPAPLRATAPWQPCLPGNEPRAQQPVSATEAQALWRGQVLELLSQ